MNIRSRPQTPGWSIERVLSWIDDGCLLFDQHLDCIYVNERASVLFGLSQEQFLGRNLRSQFATAMALEFQRAALSAGANRQQAQALLHTESEGRWLEATLYPSADGLLAIVKDITAAKRDELEAAAHTEYLQQLVDQLPAFLWVIDRDLIVRRIEGGRPMLQALDRDRLIDLPMAKITEMGSNPEDVELSVEMHRRVLQGVPGRYRATWKGITLESSIRPLCDRKGDVVGVVGIGIDVTKEMQLEAKVRQAQKLEALGQLAGGVAHDFNNLLVAIRGFAQLLREDLAGDPRCHDAEEILKAAERAARITHQLLAFSRHQTPTATRVDIIEVVHELSRMLRALLPATIALHVTPARESASIELLADRSQLEQLLMNLAVNARDAMPAGGTLTIDVRTGTTPETAHTAVIDVRDTGTGMTPEVQARVFEPFFTTKEPGRGTGLGLATVYGIVRQHSGSIDIASEVGRGTLVTVRLPTAPPGMGTVIDEPQNVQHEHSGRVLVVEDEEQVRDVTTRFLRRGGYDAVTANDAGAALRLLSSAGPFDVVLSDSAMPGMRGEDLAVEIARVQPGLPVVLMSGHADLEHSRSSSPVCAFIQKPFTIPALLETMRRVMRRDVSPPDMGTSCSGGDGK